MIKKNLLNEMINISLIALVFVGMAVHFNVKADDEITDSIKRRMAGFDIPADLNIAIWADKTLTQNPTFFSFDTKGRMLITEVNRIEKGVDDVRKYPQKLILEDIHIKTLDDRMKMYEGHSAVVPMKYYTDTSDQIRLLTDTNNNGKADISTVYATGFNDALSGIGAGVIERDGKVYYTNIPDLWLLEDKNDDGASDQRTSLQKGFGTRVSFMGHDMHGLIWGPDGRLYWSLGDRGYHFTTKEGKTFSAPNYGGVFRSNPDGSNIELFYSGLRNPQELVFDEYGNLFTADNDGDKSDTERVNHLIEGGNSGWHAGHQTIMSFSKRLELRSYKYTGESDVPVSWLDNNMSKPRTIEQPAYMLPGIGQLFTGPSGMAYNPSNNLGEQWRNTFFIAHYSGSPSGSYISTFKTETNGASFLAKEQTRFMSGSNITDIDFGPDGRMYAVEFNVGGWDAVGEGAVFALEEKNVSAALKAQRAKFKTLLTQDYANKNMVELVALLNVDHQQIRQRAQFEMAKRGEQAKTQFITLALDKSQNEFTRIHSVWGLSQLALEKSINSKELEKLLPLLTDSVAQVRIQTARVLGDHAPKFAEQALISALTDQNPQVVMYAAIGLGKIASPAAVDNVIALLEQNNNTDLWLRHSLVMALQGIEKSHWIKHKTHASDAVRLGVLLALRLINDADLGYFLQDKNSTIVNEAITAIDDLEMLSLREKSAALLNVKAPTELSSDNYIYHRLINANFNEGKAENAERLLKYAATKGINDRLAAEALAAIEGWSDLNPIDTVTGLPSKANTNRADITKLVLQYLPTILTNTKDMALVQSMRLSGKFNYQLSFDLLKNIVENQSANIDIRIQAFNLLADNNYSALGDIISTLLKDPEPELISAALASMMKYDEANGLKTAEQFLQAKSLTNKKIALKHVAVKSNNNIDQLLIGYMNNLLADKLNQAMALDLLSAAEASSNPAIQQLFQQYQTKMQSADLMTQFSTALVGGNAKQGKELFFGGDAAQCIRCHRVNGEGAYGVGPDLSNVGQKYDNKYLLEALILPSEKIAPKFGSFTLIMPDDSGVNGLFLNETDTAITLDKGLEGEIIYNKADIKKIERPISGMPPMNYILSKSEIRDLVAYLQTLNKQATKVAH